MPVLIRALNSTPSDLRPVARQWARVDAVAASPSRRAVPTTPADRTGAFMIASPSVIQSVDLPTKSAELGFFDKQIVELALPARELHSRKRPKP